MEEEGVPSFFCNAHWLLLLED
jgi:hypothetical protein